MWTTPYIRVGTLQHVSQSDLIPDLRCIFLTQLKTMTTQYPTLPSVGRFGLSVPFWGSAHHEKMTLTDISITEALSAPLRTILLCNASRRTMGLFLDIPGPG